MSPPGFRARGGASCGKGSPSGSSGPDSIMLNRESHQRLTLQVKDFELEDPGFGFVGLPPAGLSFAEDSRIACGFFRNKKNSSMTIAAASPMIAGMIT